MGSNSTTPALKIVDTGIGHTKGIRPAQEDRVKVLKPDEHSETPFEKRFAFFAIYDGHGGAGVSTFAQQNLHGILSDQLPDENSPDHFEDAVTTSLEALDRQLQKEGIGYTEGSTVSLALVDLEAGTLATADLGDSHAFLGVQDEEGGDIEVSKLSHAHKPSEPSEKKRIEDAGGTVEFIQGAHRVDSIDMSRSIGDLKAKTRRPSSDRRLARAFGKILSRSARLPSEPPNMTADWISNVPHTKYRTLTGVHRSILLLASDGLGTEEDCQRYFERVTRDVEKGIPATDIARKLAEDSTKKHFDNSTVVIVVFEA